MIKKVAPEIEDYREKYAALIAQCDYAGAFKHLANILASVQASEVEVHFADGLEPREFALEQARQLGLSELRATIEQIVQRLQRIVSIGVDPIYEEVVLILTLRVQAHLLISLARETFGSKTMEESLSFDSDLEALTSNPTFTRSIQQAQSSLKANWGVSLRTRWINSGFRW